MSLITSSSVTGCPQVAQFCGKSLALFKLSSYCVLDILHLDIAIFLKRERISQITKSKAAKPVPFMPMADIPVWYQSSCGLQENLL